MKRARCQEQAERPSPKGYGRKSTTSLSIRQALCHWLLWLVVVLLALCLPASAVVLEAGVESQVTTSESLLAPIVRHGDAAVALVFIGSKANVQVLTMRLAEIVGSRGADWHLLTAGAFVSMILPLIVFFSLQRYFVRGMMAGSVKG